MPAEELSGLNAEDMKILEELKAEGNEVAGLAPAKAAEEPKKEEPLKEVPKIEERPPEKAEPLKGSEPPKEPAKEPETERKPKYIPSWELAKREKEWQKEKADLEAKVLDASHKPPAETEDDVKALSAKYNVDEAAMRDIINVASKRAGLTPDLLNQIKELQEIGKATKATLEAEAFRKDFDSQVAPLVRAEYPGISDDELAKIREDVKTHAYRDDFLHTPLSVIYKGVDSFRGVVQPKKKTVEAARGGESRSAQVIDFDNLSDEEVKALSQEDFVKYSEYQATKEKQNNK